MLCIPFTTYRFSFGALGSIGFSIRQDATWASTRKGDVVDLANNGGRVVVTDVLRGYVWVRRV